ncbi:hypothetical protein B0H13DRAFT_2656592 [Mycena leptocephala]|nr:hypothetical protein B0H13DRAFT_2656592 [Mycena leptocephala]
MGSNCISHSSFYYPDVHSDHTPPRATRILRCKLSLSQRYTPFTGPSASHVLLTLRDRSFRFCFGADILGFCWWTDGGDGGWWEMREAIGARDWDVGFELAERRVRIALVLEGLAFDAWIGCRPRPRSSDAFFVGVSFALP